MHSICVIVISEHMFLIKYDGGVYDMKKYSCIVLDHLNHELSFTTALEIIFAHGNKEASVEEEEGRTTFYFSTLSQDELWQLVLSFEMKGLKVGFGIGATFQEAEEKAEDYLKRLSSFEAKV